VTRTVAIVNQKGGVGKTTTAINLAAALVERQHRVLVVDLDAQGCATFWLGMDAEDVVDALHVFGGGDPAALVHTTPDGVDLIASAIDLAGIERALVDRKGREFILRDALATIADQYDWIVLDCSPSLGIITINALTAASDVLIPLQCETLSHRGVGQLMETIEQVRQYTNPHLHVLGVVPTLYDGRTVHARAVLEDLEPRYGVTVFAPIHRSIRFAEAPAAGRSVLATDPRSRGAQEYRALAGAIAQPRP
jgi:chromosome partitioning protein